MLKVLSNILCDLDPKVKVIGQKAGICDGVPSTSAPVSTCDDNNKSNIFSDSLSVLKAMNHTSSKDPQIQKLLEKCYELLAYKEIALCWIPSHIGIQGNEMVDKQAKTSLSLEPTSFKDICY